MIGYVSSVTERECVSSKMNIKGEKSSLRYKKKAKITLEATNMQSKGP